MLSLLDTIARYKLDILLKVFSKFLLPLHTQSAFVLSLKTKAMCLHIWKCFSYSLEWIARVNVEVKAKACRKARWKSLSSSVQGKVTAPPIRNNYSHPQD